jgi:hypothetical protein
LNFLSSRNRAGAATTLRRPSAVDHRCDKGRTATAFGNQTGTPTGHPRKSAAASTDAQLPVLGGVQDGVWPFHLIAIKGQAVM